MWELKSKLSPRLNRLHPPKADKSSKKNGRQIRQKKRRINAYYSWLVVFKFLLIFDILQVDERQFFKLLEDYACGLGFVKEIMPACSCMWVAKIADNIELIGHLGWGVFFDGSFLV